MAKTVLAVKNLTKWYKDFLAVDKISFELKEGEILGLLGPNGAGKTSTIQMLLGLTIPTSGKISYFGKDFFENKEYCLQRLNFSSAYISVQGRITVRQNLRIFAGLYQVADREKKIDELMELLEIKEFANKTYWKLSSGQRTRVNLAKALLNSPKLLLMDEPTASLDPEIKNKVIELVEKLQKNEGVSILYTSHDMDEVTRVCDRVMFLDKGKILTVDTPLGLTKRVGEARLIITFDGKREVVEKYLKDKKLAGKFLRGHMVEISLPEKQIPKTLFGLSERKIWLTDIDIQKPDLEDVFLSVAKGEVDELAQN